MAEHPPKLHELDAFRTVLRVRSVTEAARLLGLSQPAVSKSLRQLEARLGFVLFERLGGRLYPTPEAEALLPVMEGVFASVSSLIAAARAIRQGAGDQVAVAAIPTPATVVLPRAIEAAARRQPGFRARIDILPTRQVVEAVARGVADIGLVHDILDDPMVAAEDLGTAAMACVVPDGHALAGRPRIHAQDLREVPYISYTVGSPIGLRMADAFATAGESFAPAIEVGASTALCEMALKTGMPGLVEDYVLSLGWWPTLRVLPLEPAANLRPRLLTSLRRPLSRPAKALCTEIRRIVVAVARHGCAAGRIGSATHSGRS